MTGPNKMNRVDQRQQGFTLIELLIVIAIILILISIAMPNFLEAQIRARVTRSMGQMKGIGTALDTYRNDWPTYPPYSLWGAADQSYQYLNALTTPIALLKNADTFSDPFYSESLTRAGISAFPRYRYGLMERIEVRKNPAITTRWPEWNLQGFGPNIPRTNSEHNRNANIPYSPTNGTMSIGVFALWGPHGPFGYPRGHP